MHPRPDPDFEEFARDCIRLAGEEKSPRLRSMKCFPICNVELCALHQSRGSRSVAHAGRNSAVEAGVSYLSLLRWIIQNESSGKVLSSRDREFSHSILITIGWDDDFNCHPLLAELDQNCGSTFFMGPSIREHCLNFHKR
jgi:hypothetical protein